MKIDYIYLDGYKNLSKLEIQLEKYSSMNAFIGNNGSGKSNILEALTIIFSRVKSGLPVEFDFCVQYNIDEDDYEISNREGSTAVSCNGKKVTVKNFMKALPSTVFLYYCGETQRLKELTHEYIDKDFEKSLKQSEETTFKYLTYITVDDFGAAFLANIAFENNTCSKIFEIVHVEAIHEPVTFRFKRPNWSRSGKADNLWNAIGAVRSEIEKLISIADNNTYKVFGDVVELYISDIKAFKTKWYAALDLFMSLKMLMQADILHSIDFDIQKNDSVYIFSYMDLSEGEKQLSQLLSLLDITKDHKALFLLDEFDSYLHPGWQRKFADIVRGINIRGQILFTSHSPLTLSKMNKKEIIVLKDGEALSPSVDTLNRDVTEVLEEIMEVGKRPEEIILLIKNFRNAAVHSNKSEALVHFEALKELLSDEDPFFVMARHLIENLR